jgi:hypothetical protein
VAELGALLATVETTMTPEQAIDFVRAHGVVLASGKGPVPRLAEVIAGGPIKGSWWAHPKSHDIFRVFQALDESSEVLVCRLVGGKITFVHRRLWSALVRAASRFSARQLERAGQEHTASGYHVARNVAFPEWVPKEVIEQARLLSEQEAVQALGSWVGDAQQDDPVDGPADAPRRPSRR